MPLKNKKTNKMDNMLSNKLSRKSSSTNKRLLHSKFKKSFSPAAASSFEKDITMQFMEILMMVKLYHWKTHSYAQHKATDDFYSSLNSHMDEFIEILMGKTGKRIDLMNEHTIKLIDLTNMNQFKDKLVEFKTYLVGLDNNSFMKSMSNTDLFNIRDEILGDVNKLLYLLTLD